MRPSTSLVGIFLLAGIHAAFSQSTISDPGAKQMCASVKDVELPAGDRPTPAEEKALASCVSVDAYFGFGQPADPVKARKCAYAEMDRGDKAPLGGKAILMMVYANGNWAGNNFSVCDHSSGREMYEQCAILTERFDKVERDQKFNQLISAWKPSEKKAFRTFMQEANRFYE